MSRARRPADPAPPAAAAAAGARPATLRRFLNAGLLPRVAVIAAGVPCLYVITLRGGVFFLLLVDLIVVLGLRELLQLLRAKGYRPFTALAYFCSVALTWYAWRQGVAVPLILTGSLLAIMVRELLRRELSQALAHIAVTVFGILYVGWLATHLVLLRQLPAALGAEGANDAGVPLGARLVFLLAALVWATDTGAFLCGVAFGRRPLAPRISPKKTVEGAVGGLLAAAVTGWACSRSLVPFVTPLAGTVLGLVAGIAAQLGDLVESMIKRDVGIKDTAPLLPGHGGILDRFDSLLFTAPVLYYYFRLFIF